MRWQPIETAPKDGTEVLLWRDGDGIFIGSFTNLAELLRTQDEVDLFDEETLFTDDWFTQKPNYIRCDYHPTHWMPLPKDPNCNEKRNLVEKLFGENMALIFYVLLLFSFILYSFFDIDIMFFCQIFCFFFGSVFWFIEYAIDMNHKKAVERIKMEKEDL